jgi:hypothetical protein
MSSLELCGTRLHSGLAGRHLQLAMVHTSAGPEQARLQRCTPRPA